MARKKNPELAASEASLQRMTFREKLNDAERLTREFINHLELSFLPQVKTLYKQVRKHRADESDVHYTDTSIRDSASQIFAQERFTHNSYLKLQAHLDSIQSELNRLSSNS